MKNMTKRLFSLMMAVVMMAGFAITTSAATAGIVTYEDEAFEMAPGTEYSATDLFTGFKNVMPGDTIEQLVRVVNNGKDGYTTKIYIKALGPSEIADGTILGNGVDDDGYTDKPMYQELLKQLKLTVVQVKGDKTLFEAAANETDGLTDWVLLGSLRKGGEVDLNLMLEVPLEMGNDFRDKAAAIDWAFKIEEIPDPTPSVPDTGDNTNVMLYAGMFGVAAASVILLIVLKKKKKEE